MKPHVLVVEDDRSARLTLARRLEYAGYRVTQAVNGEAALDLLEQHTFELILTDMVLGDVDGIEVLYTARLQAYQPAVILLTGHGSLDTSLAAFRNGAYDYLLKPCAMDELLSCIDRALQRRKAEQQLLEAVLTLAGKPLEPSSQPPAKQATLALPLEIGDLTIGVSRRDTCFQGQPVQLTPIEYALLCCLAETPGESRSYQDIVRSTHQYEAENAEAQSLLKPHIHNLRKKLPAEYLRNDRGKGYMLVVPADKDVSPASSVEHG